jgi:hypothetical protein
MTLPWLDLLLFAAAVALLALYGLTVSGHFPAEFRSEQLRTAAGTLAIWATLIVASAATIIAIVAASRVLPWSAIIISGGAMLLTAPLLLRAFPDRFVDGFAALVSFASGALLAAGLLWFY